MSLPITIFTSIRTIAPSLRQARPDLLLRVVTDPALDGYGGTVEFSPQRLQRSTIDQLAQAEILITEPAVLSAILHHTPHAFPCLQWCQSTYAGVDAMFAQKGSTSSASHPWRLTRFAGKFGPPMAEWCLARIIAHERSFAATMQDQKQRAWAGTRTVTTYRYLSDLTVSILGVGDIGSCIAKVAKHAFGMRVVGYVRKEKESAHLDVCTTDLKVALQSADYVIAVLPSTPATQDLLSNDMLSVCSLGSGGKCPVFLNVGRGDVVDEPSLLRALDQNYISAAILDVLPVEPLPTTSPLWDRDDVVISPHVSSITRGSDVPDVFLENYDRFVKGEPLQHVVDWDKGY